MSSVVGIWHCGITVRDMEEALRFYIDGLGTDVEYRVERQGPLGASAMPASSLDLAMLRIPGSEVRLEILEFRGLERHSGASRLVDYGAGHVCLRSEEVSARWTRGIDTGGRAAAGSRDALLDPSGYRIELVTGSSGVAHAGISVSDLERALGFYERVLGLDVDARPQSARSEQAVPQSRSITLKLPGSDSVLELTEHPDAERYSASCRACDYGAGHLCLYVDDVRGMYDRVRRQGYATRAPVIDGPNGSVIYAIDGDGYHVELFQPTPPARASGPVALAR